MWQIPYYDFYCSIITTSGDLVDLYYIWKREDRIPDILPQDGIHSLGQRPSARLVEKREKKGEISRFVKRGR